MLLSEYLNFAQRNTGKQLNEILDFSKVNKRIDKGAIGGAFETQVFGKQLDNLSQPDLQFYIDVYNNELLDHYQTDIDVELKVTAAKKLKNGEYRAKERLVLSMINYMDEFPEDFTNSHVYSKIRLMLIMYYLYEPNIAIENYKLLTTFFYNMSNHDISILERDYNIIIQKIKDGKAHELSGSDTFYLEACTKAANSSVTRQQPFSDIPAKPRAFALKNSFMNVLLNDNLSDTVEIEHNENNDLIHIENILNSMIGKRYDELKVLYAPNIKKSKNEKSIVFQNALGVKTNSLNDLSLFKKANISFKTFNITDTCHPADGVNFFMVDWNDFDTDTWEDSKLFDVLNTKYFYCYFHKNKSDRTLIFAGYKFHGFNDDDVEMAKRDWEKTRNLYLSGISVDDNLGQLTSQENELFYVRTKGQNKQKSIKTYNNGQEIRGTAWWINSTWLKNNVVKPSVMLDHLKKM